MYSCKSNSKKNVSEYGCRHLTLTLLSCLTTDVLNLLERLTKELLIQGTGASEKDVETSRHKSSDEQENTVKSFNEFKV